MNMDFLRSNKIIPGVLGVVAIAALVAGVYYYTQYNRLNNILKNPNISVQKETSQLVSQVGKLMMLPTDEQPTIATVTDASKLKDQPFFKNAKNGFKVLIYVKAKKAILFDPGKNVIIDVAPVNISQNPTPAPQAPVSPSAQIPTVIPTQIIVYPTLTPVPTK